MKVSVIMASHLGNYEGAASSRETKFIRAVDSFIAQSYPDKELVIVSDGCHRTYQLYRQHYGGNDQIKCITVPKQPIFSGLIRATGIDNCKGDVICYLDTDDFIKDGHLSLIASQCKSVDWIYYGEFIFHGNNRQPSRKSVSLQKDSIGTSSIAHKKIGKGSRVCPNWYECDGYGHDWKFVQRLMQWSNNHKKVFGAQYYICHIPEMLDN